MRGLGKHISIGGGLVKSLERARDLGCTAMQIFSRNPRGWETRPLTDEDVARFRALRAEMTLAPVVIHTNYLVNLAARDGVVRERSIAAFRDELDRAERIGAEYLVVHPGSSKGGSVAEGVRSCIEGIREASADLDLDGVTVLIENTAGQGDCIGRNYEQVAEIIDGCERDVAMGMCLDTAHTFAAGYDIATEKGFRKTLRSIDATVGLKRVHVVHFNDSKVPFGSNVDRHWHIGEGEIGLAGLGRVARARRLAHAALILETPHDAEHSESWNLDRLTALVEGRL